MTRAQHLIDIVTNYPWGNQYTKARHEELEAMVQAELDLEKNEGYLEGWKAREKAIGVLDSTVWPTGGKYPEEREEVEGWGV